MKRLTCLIVAIVVLVSASLASAEGFVLRPSAFYIPEQDMSVKLPGGPTPILGFEIDNSYGGFLELAKFSKRKYFSVGAEAGFLNLTAGTPFPGVADVDAKVYTLMAKACGHVQNKMKLTPFACGGIGMMHVDPNVELTGGANIGVNDDTTTAFSAEVGATYALNQFNVRGGVRMIKAVSDPTFNISGAPVGIPLDIDHYGFFLGAEF